MLARLTTPSLILVPNLTLQEQWRDKLERLFLESSESSSEMISTDIREIKKINIITYQSLSGSDTPDDSVHEKILDIWYDSERSEFPSQEAF
jgi:superfamily II DNA or RNA helicase